LPNNPEEWLRRLKKCTQPIQADEFQMILDAILEYRKQQEQYLGATRDVRRRDIEPEPITGDTLPRFINQRTSLGGS
jgi:hypothetical protein